MEPNDLSQLLPSYRVFTIEELKNGSYEHKEPDYTIYDAVIAKSFKSLNEAFETQCIKFGKPCNHQTKASNTCATKLKSPKEALPPNTHLQDEQKAQAASAPVPAPAPAAVPAPVPAPEPVTVPAPVPAPALEQTQVPANSAISDEAILDYDFGYSAQEQIIESNAPGMQESLAHNGLCTPEQNKSSDLDEFDLNSLVSLIDDYNQQKHHNDVAVEHNSEPNLPFGKPTLMPDSPFSPESIGDLGAKLEPQSDTKSKYEHVAKTDPGRAIALEQVIEQSQDNSQGLSLDRGFDGNADLANKVSGLLAPLHCEAQFDNEFVNHKRFRITLPNGNVYLLLIYHKQNNIISKIAFNKRAIEDNSLLQHIIELLEQHLLNQTINNSSALDLNISVDNLKDSTQQTLGGTKGKAQELKSGTTVLSGCSPWSEALLEEESKALQYGVTIQKYSQVAATNGTDKSSFYANQNPLLDAFPGSASGTAPGAAPGAAPWTVPVSVAEQKAVSGIMPISNMDQSIDDRVSGILLPLGFEVKFLQDASYQRQYEVKTHSGDSCILMIFYKGNNTISNIRFNKTPQADKVNLAKAAVELNKQLLKTKIW